MLPLLRSCKTVNETDAPMKILHAGYFSLLPKPPGYFGVASKLSNGLIANGHSVLNFSDRDVARAMSFFKNRKMGTSQANKHLLDVCASFSPDTLLLGHADVLWPETLSKVRQQVPHIKIAQWNVDPLFDPENVKRIQSKQPYVDITFCTTSGDDLSQALGEGYRTAFMPNPADRRIERFRNFDIPASELKVDILFAAGNPLLVRSYGGVSQKTGDLATQIRQRFSSHRISCPGCDQNVVTGQEYEDLLSTSAIGLNISRRNDVYLYSSDRIAHLMGNGILTFIDSSSGYQDVFSDKDAVFFSSHDHLLEQVDLYLHDDHARRTIAEKGWRRYHDLFSAERVADYILRVVHYEEHDFVLSNSAPREKREA